MEATNADNLIAIAQTPMLWQNDSQLQPLFTHTADFTATTIKFQTQIPCGPNNVDVELAMNVKTLPSAFPASVVCVAHSHIMLTCCCLFTCVSGSTLQGHCLHYFGAPHHGAIESGRHIQHHR